MALTTNAKERKGIPIVTGVMDYFPLALAEVAKVSVVGNNQHNPGQPLHWAKEKSTDHADCIGRHLIDRGKFDIDGSRHSAKLAWRALANLEIELELEQQKSQPSEVDDWAGKEGKPLDPETVQRYMDLKRIRAAEEQDKIWTEKLRNSFYAAAIADPTGFPK